MALNLIRNSRVFFTTHVDSNGKVKDTGFTDSNTFEIQVQDGFSFSQNSAQETVTLNEAGATPIRGQRSFNTSLEPADWSFSTYMRPRYVEGTVTAGYDADDIVACEESVLWGAISSSDGAGWVTSTSTSTFTDKRASYATFSGSNKHQLQPFGLVIKFDNSAYIIDNCVLDTATIDFGIDAIASIAWAGKGMNVREATIVLDATTASFHVTVSPTPVAAGVYKPKNTTAPYIANKLSTMTLTSNAATPVIYTVALTGGSLSIANNVTYLTPANLGTLNVPCTYFTGTRTITSNVTAYLKTGTGSPSALLADFNC